MTPIKIKQNVVKRLQRDYEVYLLEEKLQQEHIEKLKEKNEDEYLIKKQIEVLEETQRMIPESQRRLQEAMNDLNSVNLL